jgi:hypothetical protein
VIRTRDLSRRLHARLAGLSLGAALFFPAPADGADPLNDKRACAAASEEAQLQRIHGQLRKARDQLLLCARDVCPVLVKHDCEGWLAEVDASMPTVVISALDRNGADAGDVRVLVDGEPFLDKLDGSAAAIDPGGHTLRFEHASDPPIDEQIIVREGEKNRLLSIRFGPAPETVAQPPGTPMPRSLVAVPSASEKRSDTVPIIAYSLFGLGAVALGVAGYFEFKQLNDYATLKNGCSMTPSGCTQGEVDNVANERVYAGVTFAVGLAAAAGGAVLLLTRPKAGTPQSRGAISAPGVSLRVVPAPGGGGVSLAVPLF